MDVRVHQKKPAVRVLPSTALAVFALMAGLCAMTVLIFFGGIQTHILAMIAIASIIGGVLGRLIMPCSHYTNAYMAMFIGALVALLAHIPLLILCMLLATILASPESFSDFPGSVATILPFTYIFFGIPEIIFGAIAGYICYCKGVA